MFKFFAPILIIQAICFYHIYKHKKETYWYIIILLFPLIGALVYFFMHFNNRRNLEMVKENTGAIIDSNFDLNKAQNEADFADTVANKIRLADEYMRKQNYEAAVPIYESCFSKLTEDDEELNKKMISAYYKSADYLSAIQLGEKIKKERYFKNAREKVDLAWSYFELHDDEKAEMYFEEMNIDNTNFYQRSEFAKFLIETEQSEKAKIIIEEMEEEIAYMDTYEKKLLRSQLKEIKNLKSKLI